MHHANWRRRGRERKKLVDYRPLFSATIGYETGRRKLPLRFQISIIKLDGIVHRRNRKTMNLRHILRLPLSLSLSFAPGRTMKHSSIHLRAPFSKMSSDIFQNFLRLNKEWKKIRAYLFHFPYEIIHKLFVLIEYFHFLPFFVNQTWKRPRRIPQEYYFPPRENASQDFTSSWISTSQDEDEAPKFRPAKRLEAERGHLETSRWMATDYAYTR